MKRYFTRSSARTSGLVGEHPTPQSLASEASVFANVSPTPTGRSSEDLDLAPKRMRAPAPTDPPTEQQLLRMEKDFGREMRRLADRAKENRAPVVMPHFSFQVELDGGRQPMAVPANRIVWTDAQPRVAVSNDGFALVVHVPQAIKAASADILLTELVDFVSHGFKGRLALAAGADGHTRGQRSSYRVRAGQIAGLFKLVRAWLPIGHPHDDPVPSRDMLKTGTGFAASLNLVGQLRLVSHRVNCLLEAIDPTHAQQLRDVHSAASKRYRFYDILGTKDPLYMEGRELMYNRQTPLHADKSDPKAGWAVLVVVGPFTGGDLFIPCLNLQMVYTHGTIIMLTDSHDFFSSAFSKTHRTSVYSCIPLPIAVFSILLDFWCGVFVLVRIRADLIDSLSQVLRSRLLFLRFLQILSDIRPVLRSSLTTVLSTLLDFWFSMATNNGNGTVFPNEVLEQVMEYHMVPFLKEGGVTYVQKRLDLQRVCASWAHIVRGCPPLWTCLVVEAAMSRTLLDTHYTRSGSLPLHVTLDFSDLWGRQSHLVAEHFVNTADIITDALLRAYRLTIDAEAVVDADSIFAWLSVFQNTSIDHITFGCFPGQDMSSPMPASTPIFPACRPKSLKVAHSLLTFGNFVSSEQLTMLDFGRIDSDLEISALEIITAMQSCKRLTHLRLSSIQTSDVPARSILRISPEQRKLLTLTHLSLSVDHQSLAYLVTVLDIPNLRYLQYDTNMIGVSCLTGLDRGYRNHTWNNLQQLVLKGDLHSTDLHEIMCVFPHLQLLDLQDVVADVGDLMMLLYKFSERDVELAPSLSSIHVAQPIETDVAFAILANRPARRFSPTCTLKAFTKSRSIGKGATMYKLVESGMEVTAAECVPLVDWDF
ncbi:hypothetical protein R3P38DRAFT_3217788 [Favolaschia claudopus]|uniref:Uncharacterized protein n=1 Tax=Favolaschia claudopus TaxID=2862362 RepID=A0AAW0A4A2_9AGAR